MRSHQTSYTNNSLQSPFVTRFEPWAVAFLLSILFFLFHPDLLLQNKTPMGGDLWAIKDPVVSWDVFMPGFREFRYELFENFNILWSNLRGMGQPILGNGVQGAPLFPLSLALIWLPDQLFWSVMPIARIILISFMLFLTARNIFKMPFFAALIFAVLAGYNINIMRWINHPWTNGALSGVWYYYFLVRVTFAHEHTNSRRAWHTVGLVLGVIGMITNGFPEASALFALLTLFLYLPICLAKHTSLTENFKDVVFRLIGLHLIGFGLCSVQIIALLEYIEYTEVLDLRSDFISGAWSKDDAKPYFLSQLTVLEKTDLQRHYIRFTAGAIGTFLALQGLASLVLDRKQHSTIVNMIGIGFALSMALFVSKNFALNGTVDWIFAKTPVLSTSHFPLYFTPLFYFGSAYFAALAIASYWQNKPGLTRTNHTLKALWVLVSLYLLIRAINSSAFLFLKIPPSTFWQNQLNNKGYAFIWVLIIIAIALFAYHSLKAFKSKPIGLHSQGRKISVMICLLSVFGVALEQSHTVEAKFSGNENHLLFRSSSDWSEINRAILQTDLPLHELRTRDPSGFYVQRGLATLDNGVSAMLPPNQRLVRRTLYEAPFGGYLPLERAYFPWSGWLLSNNLTTTHTTVFSEPDWSKYSPTTELDGKMLSNATGFTGVKRQNPTKFWGWVTSYTLPHHSRVWGRFDDGENQRWMEANIADTKHKTVNGKVLTTTGWRFLLPIHELEKSTKMLTLRVVDEHKKTYQDLQTVPVEWEEIDPELETGSKLLNQYDNDSRSVYFEENALPRAFVASSCEVEIDDPTTMNKLREGLGLLNGRVILDANLKSFCDKYERNLQRVPLISDKGSVLTLGNITGPAIIHINDSYYPGWKATDINSNTELTIHRSNLSNRAILLPDYKEYNLEVRYQPNWLIWVKLATAISLVALIVYLFLLFRANQNRGGFRSNKT